MENDEFTWTVVPNTVASRMVNFSLVHKLVPSNKLRRRSKILNAEIRNIHKVKSYSQYVKIKTSVLRRVSDDSDTEDNVNLTDDDYSNVYKSDVSRTQMSNESGITNLNSSDKVEIKNNQDTVSNVRSKKMRTCKSKNKSQNTTNINWQKVVKKRSRSISPSRRKKNANSSTCTNVICHEPDDVETNTQTNLNQLDNKRSISNKSAKKNSSNAENKMLPFNEKTVELQAKDRNSIEITCNTTTVHEIISTNDESNTNNESNTNSESNTNNDSNTNNESVLLNSTENEINKILQSDKEYCYKIPNSPKKEKLEEMKENLTPLSDNVKNVQDTNDPCTSTNKPLDQNHSNLNIESDIKNNESLETQPSVVTKKHQPKDSGIEDTDEEFVEHDKKYENETQKVEQNLSTSSSNLEHKSDLVHVANDTESKNSPKVIDPEDVPNTSEKVNTSGQEHQEPQKPIVISTEIVNRKYKIIPDTSVLIKHAEPEESSTKDFWNKRLYETEDTEESIEGGVSPLSKKRLQQFRRLNLTTDSDSSSSENDITCSSDNMREKLFNRDKESDMSGTEDESIHNMYESSIQLLRNENEDKSESFSKESNYCIDNEDNNLTHCSKVEMNSCIGIKSSSSIDNESVERKSKHLNNIVNHNESFHRKNLDTEITQQPVYKRTVTYRRPCNLEELIEQEGLVHTTPKPSFTCKNIGEDELFIVDLPSGVLENQLLGSKMVLTKNKLKLGKQKYKIKYKKIDNISCVFASSKLDKPYQTVNIKPLTRIVTRQKIT